MSIENTYVAVTGAALMAGAAYLAATEAGEASAEEKPVKSILWASAGAAAVVGIATLLNCFDE